MNLREQEQLAQQAVSRTVRRSTTIDPRVMQSPRRRKRDKGTPLRPAAAAPAKTGKRLVRAEGRISVADLAHQLGAKAAEVQGRLMALGIMASVNQQLDLESRQQGREPLRFRGPGRRLPGGRGDRRDGARQRRRPPGTAPADRHRDGSRRPRQDVAARRDPQDQRGRGRGGRHHPAHRRLPGRAGRAPHHLHRHAGPRGLHPDARARRRDHRHRDPRGGRDRRHHAADRRGDRARQGRRAFR